MPEKPTRIPTLARTVRGSGPGLILVHGAGGSAQVNFGPILDDLAGNRTVVAVDLPGSGETPRSTTRLDPDQLADQVVAGADAEGLDTFALGGWSLGAPLAIHTAARHPDRVTALILTSPFARADATLDLAATIWHDLYLSGDHVMVFRLLMLLARGSRALEATSAEQRDAAAETAARFIPAGTAEQTDLVRRIDVRAHLATITAPTLVISTTDDRLVSPTLHQQVAQGIRGARLVPLETGHLAFMENPDHWRELMSAFLAEHAPAPA